MAVDFFSDERALVFTVIGPLAAAVGKGEIHAGALGDEEGGEVFGVGRVDAGQIVKVAFLRAQSHS